MSEGPFGSILAGDMRLATERFMLTPLEPADAADWLAQLSDVEVVRFLDIEQLSGVEQVKVLIERARRLRASGLGLRWAIRAKGGGELAGVVGLHDLVWERACRGEVGFNVGRDVWGAHVMDEVLPKVLAFGFMRLGLRRIQAMVTPGNVWSERLLLRNGFEREGVLREYAFWKDEFQDQTVFSKLG